VAEFQQKAQVLVVAVVGVQQEDGIAPILFFEEVIQHVILDPDIVHVKCVCLVGLNAHLNGVIWLRVENFIHELELEFGSHLVAHAVLPKPKGPSHLVRETVGLVTELVGEVQVNLVRVAAAE